MENGKQRPKALWLVDLRPGDRAEVQSVSVLSSDPALAHAFSPGDVFRCLHNGKDGVLVACPDGRRFLVPREFGASVSVQLFWDSSRGWVPDEQRRPQ